MGESEKPGLLIVVYVAGRIRSYRRASVAVVALATIAIMLTVTVFAIGYYVGRIAAVIPQMTVEALSR